LKLLTFIFVICMAMHDILWNQGLRHFITGKSKFKVAGILDLQSIFFLSVRRFFVPFFLRTIESVSPCSLLGAPLPIFSATFAHFKRNDTAAFP
jgi:hypothetical protein